MTIKSKATSLFIPTIVCVLRDFFDFTIFKIYNNLIIIFII